MPPQDPPASPRGQRPTAPARTISSYVVTMSVMIISTHSLPTKRYSMFPSIPPAPQQHDGFPENCFAMAGLWRCVARRKSGKKIELKNVILPSFYRISVPGSIDTVHRIARQDSRDEKQGQTEQLQETNNTTRLKHSRQAAIQLFIFIQGVELTY
eukprot:scaffold92729_cov54-Attheya_sp.AAC.5